MFYLDQVLKKMKFCMNVVEMFFRVSKSALGNISIISDLFLLQKRLNDFRDGGRKVWD